MLKPISSAHRVKARNTPWTGRQDFNQRPSHCDMTVLFILEKCHLVMIDVLPEVWDCHVPTTTTTSTNTQTLQGSGLSQVVPTLCPYAIENMSHLTAVLVAVNLLITCSCSSTLAGKWIVTNCAKGKKRNKMGTHKCAQVQGEREGFYTA